MKLAIFAFALSVINSVLYAVAWSNWAASLWAGIAALHYFVEILREADK